MWVSFRATGVFGVPTDSEFHKVLLSSPDKHNIWSQAAHCDFHWHHIGLLRPLGQGGPGRSWVRFARQFHRHWSTGVMPPGVSALLEGNRTTRAQSTYCTEDSWGK